MCMDCMGGTQEGKDFAKGAWTVWEERRNAKILQRVHGEMYNRLISKCTF